MSLTSIVKGEVQDQRRHDPDFAGIAPAHQAVQKSTLFRQKEYRIVRIQI